jgi:hypothetical protein
VLHKLACTHKSALRAIRFKYHDWIQNHPIDFQSATPEIMQNDECFYAYRRSVVLSPITILTRSMQGADTHACTTNAPMHQQSKGILIDIPLCFYYFSTCIAAYKKQGTPYRCTSLILLLSAHVSPCTKSKGLLIDVRLCFYYFYHMHRRIQ